MILMASLPTSTEYMGTLPGETASSSPFSDQQADSFRPVGVAVGIAVLALLIILICLLVVAIIVRNRRRQRQQQQRQVSSMPTTRRTPRQKLFPLSLPTLRSQPTVARPTSSQEHILATHDYAPSTSRAMDKEFSVSDTTTLASSTANAPKHSSDIDLEALRMPLPPPPSYQEISMGGPVRSVSGSSWVTEGPVVDEVEMPSPRYEARRKFGVKRFAARGGSRVAAATRRV